MLKCSYLGRANYRYIDFIGTNERDIVILPHLTNLIIRCLTVVLKIKKSVALIGHWLIIDSFSHLTLVWLFTKCKNNCHT